ncbi:MAG: AAA family ATPase [Deltaproteobacteria bacterium]|nr:AAA family ATPase [Deltaproteobacteria bacterium]
MAHVNRVISLAPQGSPQAQTIKLVAVTGAPGAGTTTVAHMLCNKFNALEMSMDSQPRKEMEYRHGGKKLSNEDYRDYLNYRLHMARQDKSHWLRSFHKRLKQVVAQNSHHRIVITGVMTPHELEYCRALGAKLVHLTAPADIRRRRIGLRYLNPPHPGQEFMDNLMRNHPEKWDLVIDSDEPYGEFIHSAQVAMCGLLEIPNPKQEWGSWPPRPLS